jgi:hypothetical protein
MTLIFEKDTCGACVWSGLGVGLFGLREDQNRIGIEKKGRKVFVGK